MWVSSVTIAALKEEREKSKEKVFIGEMHQTKKKDYFPEVQNVNI